MSVDGATVGSSPAQEVLAGRPMRATPNLEPVINPRQLRRTLAAFTTGVTVITVGGSSPHGMTANAFTSVSMDPPLVLVCVKHDARMHKALADADGFGISVLAAHQRAVARYFSHGEREPGITQFSEVDWAPGQRTGAPLISGAVAWFECTRWHIYDGGDHSIFIGRLVSVARRQHDRPLVFYDGNFHRLTGEVAGDSERQATGDTSGR